MIHDNVHLFLIITFYISVCPIHNKNYSNKHSLNVADQFSTVFAIYQRPIRFCSVNLCIVQSALVFQVLCSLAMSITTLCSSSVNLQIHSILSIYLLTCSLLISNCKSLLHKFSKYSVKQQFYSLTAITCFRFKITVKLLLRFYGFVFGFANERERNKFHPRT